MQTVAMDYRIVVAYPEQTEDPKSPIDFEETRVAQWRRADGAVAPMALGEDLGILVDVEWLMLSHGGICASHIVLGPESLLSAEDVKTLENRVRRKQSKHVAYLGSDACKIERERIKERYARHQRIQERI